MGWRLLFIIVGGIFTVVGILIFAIVKDPVRGGFSYNYKPVKSSAKELLLAYVKVLSVPCARWGLAGIFFKNYATTTNVSYSTRYFNTFGEQYVSMVSYWTFGVTLVGGSFAAIFIGGFLSDKYD